MGTCAREPDRGRRSAVRLHRQCWVAREAELDESPFESEALALAQHQVTRLAQRAVGLPAEANKLGIHQQALANMASVGRSPVTACPTRPTLPSLALLAGVDPLDATQFGHVFDAHLETAAHAMVCGAARVITLQTMYARSDQRFDFLDGPGIAAEHHLGLSHVIDPRIDYARAQQWLLGRLATKMLSVLSQPDPLDPAHSVLDNSIVYVLSEVSDGSSHTSDSENLTVGTLPLYTYLPQVLIGGGAGYFKPGGRLVQIEARATAHRRAGEHRGGHGRAHQRDGRRPGIRDRGDQGVRWLCAAALTGLSATAIAACVPQESNHIAGGSEARRPRARPAQTRTRAARATPPDARRATERDPRPLSHGERAVDRRQPRPRSDVDAGLRQRRRHAARRPANGARRSSRRPRMSRRW